jgi:hypothetical protein
MTRGLRLPLRSLSTARRSHKAGHLRHAAASAAIAPNPTRFRSMASIQLQMSGAGEKQNPTGE